MSTIFGGEKSKSKETSSSSNQAYGDISSAFAPLQGQAQSGASALQALLGGDSSGFNKFASATGYDGALDAGQKGITGNTAAGGLLRSGSTGKSLQTFGQNLKNQTAGSYMDRLLQQIGVGQGAGSLLSGAGQVSSGDRTSSSSKKPGMGGFLGSVLTGGVM